jgi:hypothetical protein
MTAMEMVGWLLLGFNCALLASHYMDRNSSPKGKKRRNTTKGNNGQ